jgi:hypothetical protein
VLVGAARLESRCSADGICDRIRERDAARQADTTQTHEIGHQLSPLLSGTVEELASLAEEAGLRTPAKVAAARLRATGWLLPTCERGIYEFAPGAHAGPLACPVTGHYV